MDNRLFKGSGDCSTASDCQECTGTKYSGCVWCKLAEGFRNESDAACVKGNYRGSDADEICDDYYWGQCTSEFLRINLSY